MNTTSSIFCRATDDARMLSIGRSTFWLWARQGELPLGIKLGNRVTVWKVDEIMAFVDQARKNRSLI